MEKNEMRTTATEVKDLIRQIIPNQETVFDLADSAEGKKLTVTYRQVQPEEPNEPDIARSAAVAHQFNDAETFSAYLGKYGSDGTVVLADVASRQMVAVLDEAEISDREMVSLTPIIHPLLRPWIALLGKQTPILEFALEVMKLRSSIDEPDGKELALILSQIRASKQITIAQGIGRKSLNGVMVEMLIQGSTKEAAVELPDEIVVTVPIFVGLAEQRVVFDLLITEGREDQIVAYLTSPDLESEYVTAFEKMIDVVKGSGKLVGLGVVKTRPWSTVPNPLAK